jgi:hypothetical protein
MNVLSTYIMKFKVAHYLPVNTAVTLERELVEAREQISARDIRIAGLTNDLMTVRDNLNAQIAALRDVCNGVQIQPAAAVPEKTAETFEAHGKTWTRHVPGDPMPCEPEAKVCILVRDYGYTNHPGPARVCNWGQIKCTPRGEIIGWRYADDASSDTYAALLAKIDEKDAVIAELNQRLKERTERI